MKTTIIKEIEIDLDIETVAKWFANLDDDSQCRFLVAVEAESRTWPLSADNQWYSLGGHLRHCHCSNEETREMLRSWVEYMETSDHGKDGR